MVTVDLPTVTEQTQRQATLDVTVIPFAEPGQSNLTQTTVNNFKTETLNTFLNRLKLQELIENFGNFLDELKHPNVKKDENFPTGDILNYLAKFYTNSNESVEQLTLLKGVRAGVLEKYGNQSDVTLTELNQKKKDLDEAKTRYEAIKDPEQKVGYYEGWFPIFRPMRESSLFGVFGAGLFLLLISIFMFLNMNGVSVSVELPVAGGFELPDFSMAGPWAIGGLVVGGVGAYLLYKYT